jgi:hypothetical protein
MLSSILTHQIEQLRDNFAEGSNKTPVLVSAHSDSVKVTAQVVDCDRLGLLLTDLAVERIDTNSAEGTPLEDKIDILLNRVTYLSEELTVVEKATDGSRAVVRSAKPDKRADGIYYYEFALEGDQSIQLTRWCYNFETRRRKVEPFALSADIFERLADELAEILCAVEVPVKPSISETASMEQFSAYLLG